MFNNLVSQKSSITFEEINLAENFDINDDKFYDLLDIILRFCHNDLRKLNLNGNSTHIFLNDAKLTHLIQIF